MKLLAQTTQSVSLKLPFTKRRPFKYSLVKQNTAVPSTLEFMRVTNETVREGRTHRVWPPDVLRVFQTAEITTDLQTQHYVLRDSSMSAVAREKEPQMVADKRRADLRSSAKICG